MNSGKIGGWTDEGSIRGPRGPKKPKICCSNIVPTAWCLGNHENQRSNREMVQIRSDRKFFLKVLRSFGSTVCRYLKRIKKTFFKYFSSDYVTERVVQEFFSQIFTSILQFEITQQHTYMRKNINTSTCHKLMQFNEEN